MRKRVAPLALAALAAILFLAVGMCSMRLSGPWSNPASMRAWLLRQGPYAPVSIILLQVMQVVLAPIPGQAVGLAAGYLYGAGVGTLLSLTGTALGSLVAFGLARLFGRPLVERVVPPEWLSRLDAGAQKRGLLFFLIVYLLPFLPDDMACYVAGLTSIPIPALMAVAVLGRAPGLWVSCWLGANATGLSKGGWVLVITGAGLLVLGLVFWGERVTRQFMDLAGRTAPDR
jgi:uncharacterized membrane protein YdjX (TVP38/TMEM64 family)